MKIIHITDFHLVAPGTPLYGSSPHERADQCFDDIARWHSDADLCVISGDLAHNGEAEAYAWLADRLKRFPLKTFVMMGNHDDRAALRAAFPDAGCDANGYIQDTFATPQGVLFFLDTHKAEVSEGQYCEDRRRWLKQQLAAAADQPVWIFMHHPPCNVGMPYMDRIKLEDADAFADIISSHNNIRHIFFGHVHRAAYINWRGIACTCLPGTNHQVPLVRDSVSTNYSVEPAMYGVVLIEDDQTTVHFDACLGRSAVSA